MLGLKLLLCHWFYQSYDNLPPGKGVAPWLVVKYSQTYSNDHLYKTTNAEPAQSNSHAIVTVQDDHLSNATSNHFFVSQMKKTCLKQPLQNFTQRKNHKQKYGNNALKTNISLIIFTLLLLYNSKFVYCL